MPTRKELIADGVEIIPLTREEIFLQGGDISPLNVKEKVLKGVVGGGAPVGGLTFIPVNVTVPEGSTVITQAFDKDGNDSASTDSVIYTPEYTHNGSARIDFFLLLYCSKWNISTTVAATVTGGTAYVATAGSFSLQGTERVVHVKTTTLSDVALAITTT